MTKLAKILREASISEVLEQIEDTDLFALTVPGQSAVRLWRKLHKLVERTGFSPVILGDRAEAIDTLADAREMDPAPASETIAYAATIDVAGWIRKKIEMDPEIFENLNEGPWTPDAASPMTDFTVPFDVLSKQPFPAVLVALAPCRNSADIPAYLRFGGWNACPEAAVHVAFARHWHQCFGAEIVSSSRNVVEMMISRPPTTRPAALALAREQFHYCSDIVDQGVTTISNLAATLLNEKIWYFWWD